MTDAGEPVEDPFRALRDALRSPGGDEGRRRLVSERWPAVVGVVLLLAAGFVGFSALRPTGGGVRDGGARADALVPSTEAPTTTAASSTAPPVPERLWPNDDAAAEVAGNEVRVGGERWTVGASGDVVAVGDWDCDGSTTPAVLRPSSGRLYVFDGWAALGEERVGRGVSVVAAGATSLEVRGCGEATVRLGDGSERVVSTMEGSDG